MVASQARIDANRENSLKSTGPRRKDRSRGNALKHGLCSLTVVPESDELIRERTAAFVEAFRPEGDYPLWLAGQAALASIRIERAQRMERATRDRLALRAEVCWDDDRHFESVRLGQTIGKAPEVVVEQLRRTSEGCDWLIGRWALLAHAAESNKGWTPEQAQVAFDLLGTPVEFRQGRKPGASIDSRGRVLDPADEPAAVARRMVDELERRRELLGGLDEAGRALAESDLDDETDPALKRLRRYEASLHRRLRWCLDQLEPKAKAEPAPALCELIDVRVGRDEPPRDGPPPEPAPSASPGVEALIAAGRFSNINLPYGFKPFGFPTLDQFAEIPEPPARAEKKLRKADARRESRRRKLEKVQS